MHQRLVMGLPPIGAGSSLEAAVIGVVPAFGLLCRAATTQFIVPSYQEENRRSRVSASSAVLDVPSVRSENLKPASNTSPRNFIPPLFELGNDADFNG